MIFPFHAGRHLAVIGLAIFFMGALVGVGSAYALYDSKLQDMTRTSASLLSLTQRQYQQLAEQRLASAEPERAIASPTAAPLGSTAAAVAPLAVLPASPAVLPSSAATTKQPTSPVEPNPIPVKAPVVAAPAKSANIAPKAPPVVQPQIAKVVPMPVVTPAKSIEAAVSPKLPVTPAGAITMDQAGIAGIDTASVRFKSGRQINVGGEFPTGEKLLSVNPGEGRIVTDRRVILLAKPPMAQ